MTNACSDMNLAVDFVPSVEIEFLSDVPPGMARRVSQYQASRSVVDSVCSAGQPQIQILRGHRPAAMGIDGRAPAPSHDVLPSELIGDAETVVRGRIHRIERAVLAVGRIFVADA